MIVWAGGGAAVERRHSFLPTVLHDLLWRLLGDAVGSTSNLIDIGVAWIAAGSGTGCSTLNRQVLAPFIIPLPIVLSLEVAR